VSILIISLLALLAGIVLGAALFGFIYLAYDSIKAYLLKRRCPAVDDVKIKGPPKLDNQIVIKEVEDVRRREDTEFREFEKLRRFKAEVRAATNLPSGFTGAGEVQRHSILPEKYGYDVSGTKSELDEIKSTIRSGDAKDSKRIQLAKRSDL